MYIMYRVVSVNRGTPLLTDSEVFDPKKWSPLTGMTPLMHKIEIFFRYIDPGRNP
jgi:hypothetical protein